MDRTRSMPCAGVRRTLLRAAFGGALLASLPGRRGIELAAAGGKHKKRHKKCKKKCKKLRKQCDKDCNELPDGEQSQCKDSCKIAQKQCKKVC